LARFVLQPCKIRSSQFVDLKDEPVELDWPKLVELLAPSHSFEGLMNLRRLSVGAYIGLARHPHAGVAGNFLFVNPGRSGGFKWLLRSDPDFAKRVISVYRVCSLLWDHNFSEPEIARAANV